MSEIKFSKEQFDKKVSYLSYMANYIDVNPGWAVSKGSCDSPAINDFAEIHELLRQTVRDYVWTLDNMVESLTNAGNALYNMDEIAGNGISNN